LYLLILPVTRILLGVSNMNPSESADIRWISLRPSSVNLGLTLIAPLCAVGLLFVVDLPDWGRALIATAVFLVTMIDVYFVRQRNARAISAFALDRRHVEAKAGARQEAAMAADEAGESQQKLVLRLRYRFPGRAGGAPEVEATVLPRCYVSTYFSSISYLMPGDPAWRRWFPRVLPIWADGIDADDFRHVRVLLKWR
jgi:hypothetical protein